MFLVIQIYQERSSNSIWQFNMNQFIEKMIDNRVGIASPIFVNLISSITELIQLTNSQGSWSVFIKNDNILRSTQAILQSSIQPLQSDGFTAIDIPGDVVTVRKSRINVISIFREGYSIDHRNYIIFPLSRNTMSRKNFPCIAAVFTSCKVFPIVNIVQKRSIHYVSIGSAFLLEWLCEQCSFCQFGNFEGVSEAMGIIYVILSTDAIDGFDHGFKDGVVDEFDSIHQQQLYKKCGRKKKDVQLKALIQIDGQKQLQFVMNE